MNDRLKAASVIIAAGCVAWSFPGWAQDTEQSLLIGLGLTAATGKTALGDGAGAVESGILNQEGLQQAGAIISMVARQTVSSEAYSHRRILVVGQADTVDFSLPKVLAARLQHVTAQLGKACTVKPQTPPPPKSLLEAFMLNKSMSDAAAPAAPASDSAKFFGGSPRASDFFGAPMVDRAVTGVTLATADRQLVNAVLMKHSQPSGSFTIKLDEWNVWNGAKPTAVTAGGPYVEGSIPSPSPSIFRSLGEPQQLEDDSKSWTRYEELRKAVDGCQYPESAKSWLEVGNTVLESVLSTEKGSSPLAQASQIESLADTAVKEVRKQWPLVLRVAVDHSGGTAISRTGILYSLGLPNAATVGAGLVASFKLVDPYGGQIVRQGFVRCAVDQTNIRRMRAVLEHREFRKSATQPRPLGATICDFKVA